MMKAKRSILGILLIALIAIIAVLVSAYLLTEANTTPQNEDNNVNSLLLSQPDEVFEPVLPGTAVKLPEDLSF
ncbi:hypothetical protein AKJ18_34005, partial [Vibrio xuii]